eukprot:SAG11_NODE_3590_length_2350_cov_7.443803_2_plen_68_part_00
MVVGEVLESYAVVTAITQCVDPASGRMIHCLYAAPHPLFAAHVFENFFVVKSHTNRHPADRNHDRRL